MFLGIHLQSHAADPIEFEIARVSAKINNIVPARTDYAVKKFIIPPNGNAWFDDHVIDIGQPPQSSTLQGFAEFDLKYGHPGSLKNDLVIKKQVILAFNAQGLFEHASWQDAA